MSIQLEPISSVVGVELKGFDPRTTNVDDLRAFQNAFATHHMVLLRGHELTSDDCVRLTELLGRAEVRRKVGEDTDKTMMISNVHKGGHLPNGELLFHSDGMFHDKPLKAISLTAMAVPSKGGETRFANAILAYERLPAALKERVATLKGRHVWAYEDDGGNRRPDPDDFTPETQHAISPLVWEHPDTGAKVLVASKMFTDSIDGLSRAESDALLDELFGYLEDPEIIYDHSWQVGDYLVWDNRALQHARTNFDPREKRAMLRVPIIHSETPVIA